MLNLFEKNYVIKPNNLSQYREVLLKKSVSNFLNFLNKYLCQKNNVY